MEIGLLGKRKKDFYAKVFEALSDLDKDFRIFCCNLANYNPQALIEWKKILWENTGTLGQHYYQKELP